VGKSGDRGLLHDDGLLAFLFDEQRCSNFSDSFIFIYQINIITTLIVKNGPQSRQFSLTAQVKQAQYSFRNHIALFFRNITLFPAGFKPTILRSLDALPLQLNDTLVVERFPKTIANCVCLPESQTWHVFTILLESPKSVQSQFLYS
jgi:hypothetical protein